MRVVALAQAFNEGIFMKSGLEYIYPLVDQIVISEGRLTPFGNLPMNSTDDTREIIENFPDRDNKITFLDAYEGDNPNDREKAEGNNKNRLLAAANLEEGDVVFIWDIDEFFAPEAFNGIKNLMRLNYGINFVRSEERQFAYGTKYCFKSSHGRFYRYRQGSHFTTTNHFIYNGEDLSRKPDIITEFDSFPYYHFSYAKHPQQIREKVLSFNRPSFTAWFNNVYLEWPFCENTAYNLNRRIPPYFGKGFCEGQHEKLSEFQGALPIDFELDFIPYIKEHKDDLKI